MKRRDLSCFVGAKNATSRVASYCDIVCGAMTESDSTSARPAPDDLTCAACGYALRGLHDTASCPECGHAVRASRLAAAAMTKRDLAMILCKLMGLWLVLSLLNGISIFLWYVFRMIRNQSVTSDWDDVISQAIYYGVSTSIGIGLWFGASGLARRIVPQDGRFGPTAQLAAGTISRCGVFLIGVWCLATGLHELIGGIWLAYSELPPIPYGYSGIMPYGVNGLAKCVIGIALMVGWARLLALWRMLRRVRAA